MTELLLTAAIALTLGFLAGERAAFRGGNFFDERAFSSLSFWGRFFNINWKRP